jgi:hypothetical protein
MVSSREEMGGALIRERIALWQRKSVPQTALEKLAIGVRSKKQRKYFARVG